MGVRTQFNKHMDDLSDELIGHKKSERLIKDEDED